ncbi:SAM-dependent methyltransferase [Dactylosporangium sp. CA-233914]|uniref:SAM-dependent methyltransferase n=1 Tax=Dactylosporangium sp. CA-233914 TaxID=3239934 RepID=UPI003D9049BE
MSAGTQGNAPTGVGRTALGVAVVRAMESRRRDRLFDDPYAGAFLAAAQGPFIPSQRGTAALVGGVSATGAEFWSRVVLRTRFFDDHLLAVAAGGVGQVVLLAAGLDTRAHRLDWPAGTNLFELDLPEVLAFKRKVLRRYRAVPRCAHRPVAADLRGPWGEALSAAGLDSARPTAWLLEGLLIYLTPAETEHVLATVDALSAPGSVAAFEYESVGATALRASAARLPGVAQYAALWRDGQPDAGAFLAGKGWRIEAHPAERVQARYGRGGVAGGFVTATRA